jgi:hypothetical protein
MMQDGASVRPDRDDAMTRPWTGGEREDNVKTTIAVVTQLFFQGNVAHNWNFICLFATTNL